MREKDDKILMEIYKRTYAVATPPADFDVLLANATLDEHNRKVIPYDDYELEEGEYFDILKDTEDGTFNWQKLINEANKEEGKEEEW